MKLGEILGVFLSSFFILSMLSIFGIVIGELIAAIGASTGFMNMDVAIIVAVLPTIPIWFLAVRSMRNGHVFRDDNKWPPSHLADRFGNSIEAINKEYQRIKRTGYAVIGCYIAVTVLWAVLWWAIIASSQLAFAIDCIIVGVGGIWIASNIIAAELEQCRDSMLYVFDHDPSQRRALAEVSCQQDVFTMIAVTAGGTAASRSLDRLGRDVERDVRGALEEADRLRRSGALTRSQQRQFEKVTREFIKQMTAAHSASSQAVNAAKDDYLRQVAKITGS